MTSETGRKYCTCCGVQLSAAVAVLLCTKCFHGSVIPSRGDDVLCTEHGNRYNPKDVTR